MCIDACLDHWWTAGNLLFVHVQAVIESGINGVLVDPCRLTYVTVASNTRSSETLHTSTSSILLGLDDTVMTQLVPTNVVPKATVSARTFAQAPS
jgi:hypothetical protein